MISIIDQLEAYRKNHIEPNTIYNLKTKSKDTLEGAEREMRRNKIYEIMCNGEIWTTKDLEKILGWEIRQISSAMKVLVDNGFVKIVGHIRVNSCKMCLYKRMK